MFMHFVKNRWLAALLLVTSPVLFADEVLQSADEAVLIHRAAQHLSMLEIEARMAQSDLVAVVNVIHINSLVSPGLSMPGMLAVQGYEYHAEIEQHWKGAQPKNLTVRVDLTDCSERLHKGQRYLVVSRLNTQAELQSFRCDDLIHQSQAGERIAQFNQLTKLQVAIN